MAKVIVCGCHTCFREEAARLRDSKASPKRSQLTTPRKSPMTRFPSIKEFPGDGKKKRSDYAVFPCLAKIWNDKVLVLTKRTQKKRSSSGCLATLIG
jgi:hypothetical protein